MNMQPEGARRFFSTTDPPLYHVQGVFDTVTEPLPDSLSPPYDSLPENAELYAGILLAVVALVLIWYAYRHWYKHSPGKELRDVLAVEDEVTILMHPNPDPDAMGAALGVKAIADHVGTESTIQYTGQIRHQENRAFKNVLNMECEQIEMFSEIRTPDATVLVDHNTARGFTESEKLEPIAVVDHHPGNGTGTQFTDVRDSYGSASAIVSEYLFEVGGVLEATLDDESEETDALIIDSDLATGLTYGVQSDTQQLTRGCIPADFRACERLFNGIDEDALNRISNPTVSHDMLKVKAEAISNIMIDGSFGVCNVGQVEATDALSQAADELMRIEGVTAVVVYGKRNGVLSLSGRSRDDRVHMGETLQHAVSDIDMASAGGHARMGGGQIPINQINDFGSQDGLTFEQFNEMLFDAMNGDF